jgi:peptidoglycan/LPS O-acetylase OafA/YrhL
MSAEPRPEPLRLVNFSLLLWGLVLIGLSVPFAFDGKSWVVAPFAVGGITAGLGVFGLRRREWVRPLFAALYLLAIGCVVVGPLTDIDIYPAAGCISLCVLSVGSAILHRLGPR